MNCKICLINYDSKNLRHPQVIIPCCHTFCAKCLDSIIDLSCPDCGELIQDRKLNLSLFELIDQKGLVLQQIHESLNQLENAQKTLHLNYEMKLKENSYNFKTIENEITKHVQKEIEMILAKQIKVEKELKQVKTHIDQVLGSFLDSNQKIESQIELIKTSLANSDSLVAYKLESLKTDLHRCENLLDVKLKEINNTDLNIKLKVSDNTKDITIDHSFKVTQIEMNKKAKNLLDVSMTAVINESKQERKSLKRKLPDGNEISNTTKKILALEFYNKGNQAKNNKDFSGALKLYNKAIELNPSYLKAYNNKGSILREMNNYDEAIKCFDKTLEIDPNYYYGYDNKGICYMLSKEYNKAIGMFDKAIEFNPEDLDARDHKEYALNALKKSMELSSNQIDKAINPKDDDEQANKYKELSSSDSCANPINSNKKSFKKDLISTPNINKACDQVDNPKQMNCNNLKEKKKTKH